MGGCASKDKKVAVVEDVTGDTRFDILFFIFSTPGKSGKIIEQINTKYNFLLNI